jgi:hypothetical protein
MYRVHDAIYAVDQFNPSPKGNARFSPILDPSGKVIPTLYAATTPRGALMESVFRDIPYVQDSSTSMPKDWKAGCVRHSCFRPTFSSSI